MAGSFAIMPQNNNFARKCPVGTGREGEIRLARLGDTEPLAQSFGFVRRHDARPHLPRLFGDTVFALRIRAIVPVEGFARATRTAEFPRGFSMRFGDSGYFRLGSVGKAVECGAGSNTHFVRAVRATQVAGSVTGRSASGAGHIAPPIRKGLAKKVYGQYV